MPQKETFSHYATHSLWGPLHTRRTLSLIRPHLPTHDLLSPATIWSSNYLILWSLRSSLWIIGGLEGTAENLYSRARLDTLNMLNVNKWLCRKNTREACYQHHPNIFSLLETQHPRRITTSQSHWQPLVTPPVRHCKFRWLQTWQLRADGSEGRHNESKPMRWPVKLVSSGAGGSEEIRGAA